MRRELLRDLVALTPFEPATCLFRAVEVGRLLECDLLATSGRVLDLGCGNGRIGGLIRKRVGSAWELVGVDRDPSETALAEESSSYSRVHTCDAALIPEPSESFDLVFSNSVLEHVPALSGVLREVRRLLRPGGYLVITVPSDRFHESLSGPGLLGWLATGERSRAGYLRAVDARLQHVRYWSAVEWEEALGKAGLRLERASHYLDRQQVRRWEGLANLTGGLLTRIVGRGARPIEVQRRLGLRGTTTPSWARWASLILCRACLIGVNEVGSASAAERPEGACLLLTARRG